MNTSLCDKMHLRVLLIVCALSVACGQDRKIKAALNPGCTGCTTQNTLVYIRAEGPKDTMHLIWDFTGGTPRFLFRIGDINSTMSIEWDGTTVTDVVFNGTNKYQFVTFLTKLYEYNDTDDSGYMKPDSPHHSHPLKQLSWNRVKAVFNDKKVELQVDGHFWNKPGIVEVKLQYIPFTDYAPELPHLIHTANSTLVDISLVNLTSSKDFNSSRFALNMVLLPTDLKKVEDLHFMSRKSLDDEHTPGVFEIIEIKTPRSYGGDEGGFLQFRPVAYTDPKREVSSSTNVNMAPFNSTTAGEARELQRRAYAGAFSTQTFVSFGSTGDGFYAKHNYTSWSFTIGYGSPPIEGFSLFVIIIISIGLGVPVLLALSGVVYVIVRRYRQKNAPQRFTDEE